MIPLSGGVSSEIYLINDAHLRNSLQYSVFNYIAGVSRLPSDLSNQAKIMERKLGFLRT